MDHTVFSDAACAIALAAPRDAGHVRALELADEMERAGTLMVTTDAVLLEISNALSRQRFRAAGAQMLKLPRGDRKVNVVMLTERYYERGFRLYCDRSDKEWGMTDCVSHVVMTERGLREVLTSDAHFRQMGFHTLL